MMFLNKYIYQCGIIFLTLILINTLIGCNREFPNLLKQQSEQPNYESASAKVLYIIVDGVRGKAIPSINMKNLNLISRNSLYSVGGLGNYDNIPLTKESSMTSLMTGVLSAKHLVKGDDYSKANLNQYPSILSRINSQTSDIESAAFTSDVNVTNTLFKDADVKETLKDDAQILERAIKELKSGTSDFTVCHFTEPFKVGEANSFESDDQVYTSALLKFDNYLGQLVEGIRSRPDYNRENWLLVITSSIGGDAKNTEVDNTFYGDNERNTITYFYSPKFSRSVLSRPNSTQIPFDGNSVTYIYNNKPVNATLEDASLFNFSNTDDFTINFFIRTNNTGNHNYPIILSKRIRGFESNGWNLFLEERDGNNKIGWNSNISDQVFGTKQINDGKWHSFTVTVHRSGETDSVKVYTDGVFNAKAGIFNNSLNNDAPLVIGRKVGNDNDGANISLANLQIYNKALTQNEVANLVGITYVDESHPKWENLIGYWPGYDDIGTNKLTDVTSNKNHMILTGDYSWTSFSDIVSHFKPQITESFYKLVPNAVDHPFFIYQWFGIIPRAEWALDGRSWTPTLLVSTNQ